MRSVSGWWLVLVVVVVVVAQVLASGTAAGCTWPVVKQTSNAPRATTTIQYLLNYHGYPVKPNGVWGSDTTSAIIDFQQANGLSADGIVGKNTWSVLIVDTRLNDRGSQVSAVQDQLAIQYHYNVQIDGIFGTATQTAVSQFQQCHGLAMNGVVQYDTWLTLVAGCNSSYCDKALSNMTWSEIGNGVYYAYVGNKTNPTSDPAPIFIGYGGYSVRSEWSQTWVNAIYTAALSSRGFAHLYAVKGPKEADYASKEIGNTKLISHLLTLSSISRILVSAHSSGSYVAQEFLYLLYTKGMDSKGVTKGKIDYYNLDGGSMYLSTSIVNSLAQVIFTYAYDSRIKTYSHNYSSMLSLTATYSSTGRARSLQLNATSSGCNAGATWCMHDTVINQHPYNPNTYDLEADYTQFDANHPVTTIYLKQSIRS